MADLIDRQALLEWFKNWSDYDEFSVGYITGVIDDVPAARARWEYVNYGGIGNWHCSACRAINQKRTNFCPTCGRDMRGDFQ